MPILVQLSKCNVTFCNSRTFKNKSVVNHKAVAIISGNTFLTFDIEPLSDNPDESYTRSPDITGETFEQHSSIATANGALFSPGHKLDGTDF